MGVAILQLALSKFVFSDQDPPSPPSPSPHPPSSRRDQITQIVKLRSQRLVQRMAEKRMVLDLQACAVEFLASVG